MKKEVFEIPKYNGACIYAILNAEDLKAYVGSTRNAQKRALEHASVIRRKKHPISEMNDDAEKRFEFLVLQKVDDDISLSLLHALEKMYMLEIDFSGWTLYNKQPQRCIGDYGKMCVSIAQDFMYINKTKDKFNKAFKERYGFEPWYLKVTKPENRNRAINETMERDKEERGTE